MKYNKNKKGVSAIVATSLIILITVAAISIVWAVVIPLVRDSTEGGLSCFEASKSLEYITKEGFTCVNTTSPGGNVSVQISRASSEIELTGFMLRVTNSDTGNSESYEVYDYPSLNSKKVLEFDTEGEGYTTNEVYEIAAIISQGNVDSVCDDGFVQLDMVQCSDS